MDRIRTRTSYAYFASGMLHFGAVLVAILAESGVNLLALVVGLLFFSAGLLILRGGKTPLVLALGLTLLSMIYNLSVLLSQPSLMPALYLILEVVALVGVWDLLTQSRVPRHWTA